MMWVLGAYGFGIGLIAGYALVLRRRRIKIESAIERATRGADPAEPADADAPW